MCAQFLNNCNIFFTVSYPKKIQGVAIIFKHFYEKIFFSRAFQAPLKSNIKFLGFSRTSRSSTNHDKIPMFGVSWPNSKQDTAIWKCQNLQRNVWPSKRCLNTAFRWPYISLLILTFLNHCISVKTSLINTKPGDFVNLGVLFLTMSIRSIVANPIIYRLVPSPSRFENRQWLGQLSICFPYMYLKCFVVFAAVYFVTRNVIQHLTTCIVPCIRSAW